MSLLHPIIRPVVAICTGFCIAASLLLVGTTTLAAQERPAVRIPGVTVNPERDWCPRRDDRRARELWSRTRALYDSAAVDTLSLWVPLRNRTRRVRADEVRLPDSIPDDPNAAVEHEWNVSDAVRDASGQLFMTQRTEPQGAGERGMNGLWRREWRVRMGNHGYALPYAPTGTASADIGSAYARWEYPPLEAELATHFVEAAFGARHLLELEPGSERAPRIRFCSAPAQRGRPGLEGTLHLAADGALRRVDWRFRTRDGDEDAGAVVEFAPRPPAIGLAVPLPARSVYFRREGPDFFMRQQLFGEWRTGPRAAWLQALGATSVAVVEPRPDAPVHVTRNPPRRRSRPQANESLDRSTPRRLH